MKTALFVLRDIVPLFIAFVAGLYAKDAQRNPHKIFSRRECLTIMLIALAAAVVLALNNRFLWLV